MDLVTAAWFEHQNRLAMMLDEIFVPHLGWLRYPRNDEVARFLGEGWFEYREQAFLWMFLRPGDAVLDAGAHFGVYSALAAHLTGPDGRVVAVEANPACLEGLGLNLAAYAGARGRLVHAALTSRDGEADYFPSPDARSAYGGLAPETPGRASVRVTARTLASLCVEADVPRFAIAKIDVEGEELEVLQAAPPPEVLPVLMIECAEANLRRRGSCTLALLARLAELRYAVCRFDPERRRLEPLECDGPIWWENLIAAVDPDEVNSCLAGCEEPRARVAGDILRRGALAAALRADAAHQRAAEAEKRAAQAYHLLESFTGAEAKSASTLEHLAKKGFRPRAVLDAGAARGYWSLNARVHFPEAEFFMVEPLLENEPDLRLAVENWPGFHYIPVALGDSCGEAQITVTPALVDSFCCPFPDAEPSTIRTVPMRTVDDLLRDGLILPPDLVKIDVQGHELKVLSGAARALESVEVLIVEANLYRFLPVCALAHEVIGWLAERGFVLYDLAGSLRRPFENDLAQVDLVFAASRSPLVASTRWS